MPAYGSHTLTAYDQVKFNQSRLCRNYFNNIMDLQEVIHRLPPYGGDFWQGLAVKHKIRKIFFADAFVTQEKAKRRKRFESPILKKLTMSLAAPDGAFASFRSLKIPYSGLAVPARNFVVSDRQKGRNQSLKTIQNR